MPKGQKTQKTPEQLAADKIAKRVKFVELAQARGAKVQAALVALSKLANKRAYEFGEVDITSIEKVLKEECNNTVSAFRHVMRGGAVAGKTIFALATPEDAPAPAAPAPAPEPAPAPAPAAEKPAHAPEPAHLRKKA